MKKLFSYLFLFTFLAISMSSNVFADASSFALKTKAYLFDNDTNDVIRPSTKKIGLLIKLTNVSNNPIRLRDFRLNDRFQLITINSIIKNVNTKVTWSSNTNPNLNSPFVLSNSSPINLTLQPQQTIEFTPAPVVVAKGLDSRSNKPATLLPNGYLFADYSFTYIAADNTTATVTSSTEDAVIRVADVNFAK